MDKAGEGKITKVDLEGIVRASMHKRFMEAVGGAEVLKNEKGKDCPVGEAQEGSAHVFENR